MFLLYRRDTRDGVQREALISEWVGKVREMPLPVNIAR